MSNSQSQILPKLAGVCGWPIHHSLSPVLHNHWLRQAGLRGAYIPFALRQDLAVEAFQTLPRTSISGVNVTLPLKGEAYAAADHHSDEAIKLGVANCLYRAKGKLVAHNTDMEGFAAPLLARRSATELQNMSALIIGAGGAARAVIAALLQIGVPEIALTNRTDARAEDLANRVGIPSLHALPWADRDQAVTRAGLIVNASAGGMQGKPALDISLIGANPAALVYDLIYTPERTDLIVQAEDQGLETLGGLAMLIAQARPSFKLFFGQAAPEGDPSDVLRAALASGRR